MNNKGFESVDYIIDRLFRDYGFHEKDVHKSDIIEWVTDVLRKLPIKEVYFERGNGCDNRPVYITIENNRGILPCDFIELKDVRVKDTMRGLSAATDTFFQNNTNPRRTSISPKLEFKIRNPYIFVDFIEGEIELAYYCMPLDEDNYPLIIADEKVLETVVSYIAYRIAFKLAIKNEFPDNKKNEFKDIYSGNLLSCRSYLNTPTFKQALNILANSTGIHTRLDMANTNFKDFGEVGR